MEHFYQNIQGWFTFPTLYSQILANNCIPYFTDLYECLKNTLTNYPKELLLEARELASNFDESKYFSILNELFEYTKSHLTTKELAKYVLEKIA